ncbi:MAG: putative membrane protein YfcA [Methylophagaceae bacterium]|jgi:uncharacterized membrane protein YfcA
MIEWISFAIIGIFAGLSAGLLGLGGGLISVPALLYVFKFMGMPSSHLMHIAVSTSLMAIVVTSFSSLIAHHRRQNVDWPVMRELSIGLVIGGFLGAYSATLFSSEILQRIFAVYAFLMSIRLWSSVPKLTQSATLLTQPTMLISGTIFGSISTIVGMGGGTMIVPYLLIAGKTIQRAIGTSAACAFPIAIAGVLGFVLYGEKLETENLWQMGYVNWQAFLGLISTSILFAPVGAKWAEKLPMKLLEKLFSLVLMAVSASLFFG